MKKLILLLSVLSIFLIPSFSFADSPSLTGLSLNPFTLVYTEQSGRYVCLTSTNPIRSDSKIYINGDSKYSRYIDGEWTPFSSLSSTSYTAFTTAYGDLISSNHDIYDLSGSSVFFSPPVIITRVAEELPPVVAQAGGKVLSVVLTGFGLLLVVSLIPRLVKRFLY